MDELPITGGIILKLGERSSKIRARDFHLELRDGVSTLVYKSSKILTKQQDATIELKRNFFVKPVRSATEHETGLVTTFAKENTVFSDLVAKRCFDVDFFEPDFPPAIGPNWLRTITLFATPDDAIGDLWGYLSSVMIDQGVFAPSSDDPERFVIVNVGERRKSITTSPIATKIIPIPSPTPSPPGKGGRLSVVDAEILLNSLPLPPTSEYVDVSNEISEAEEGGG
jgi:hypothetical protein